MKIRCTAAAGGMKSKGVTLFTCAGAPVVFLKKFVMILYADNISAVSIINLNALLSDIVNCHLNLPEQAS